MKFINKGEPIKIRIGTVNECRWDTIKKNEVVELSREIGLKYGFEELKTTEGQLGEKVVQTKQIENISELKTDFLRELQKINGIGKKTAQDLLLAFPTKESLIDGLNKGRIPVRDDIEEKLRRAYGK